MPNISIAWSDLGNNPLAFRKGWSIGSKALWRRIKANGKSMETRGCGVGLGITNVALCIHWRCLGQPILVPLNSPRVWSEGQVLVDNGPAEYSAALPFCEEQLKA